MKNEDIEKNLISLNGNVTKPDDFIAEVGAKIANDLAKTEAEKLQDYKAERIGRLINNPKTPLFYESITQALDPHSGARIRVWRREEELPQYNDAELQMLINQIPGYSSMEEVVKILSSLERVTAIELIDPNGNGAVIYLEW